MLSQGGEFAFVILAQAGKLSVISNELGDQIILIVGISMALTAPLVSLANRLLEEDESCVEHSYDIPQDESKPEVIIAGFGRFGQVIGRMLSANGIHFTALDKDAAHVDFVKQYGNQIYYGDATRIDLLRNAGIADARLIIVAVDGVEDSMQIVRHCREYCENIKIIARAHNRMHAYQLYALNVDRVIRETFDSSVQAASHTLVNLGFTEGQALERADMFRLHDENLVLQATEHKDDLDQLLHIAKQGRKELEQLFAQDSSA